MSTQNAKRMMTWMGSRYMGHSHGNLSAEIPPFGSAFICRWVSGTRSRSASAKAANRQKQFRMAVCRDMPGVLSALDGFDMAKPYPLSALPRNAPISIAVNCLAKT